MANIATTITEIVELKIRELAAVANTCEPVSAKVNSLTPAAGWVGKKQAAEHLKIRVRSLDNWMRRGMIPYIRLGRSVRFKLSEVDEAINPVLDKMNELPNPAS